MGAIDDALSTGVNANMCSEMCQCLGGPTSSQKIAYLKFTETQYNSFGRTKALTDQQKYTKMFWTPDNTKGFTNLLECKEGLGPRVE